MSANPLPWLGLGLTSNLGAHDSPQPYRLLDAAPGLFDFVEYSAPLSLSEARREAALFPEMMERRVEVPVLFHPVHLDLWGPRLEEEAALTALAEHARAVDSPWVGNDIGWWHGPTGAPFPGYLYLPPSLDDPGADLAIAHARHIQRALGDVPLALENPALMGLKGDLHVLDFMRRVLEAVGAPFVLDLGHLLSYQLAVGRPLLGEDLERIPFEQVIEIHLAGGVVSRRGSRRIYADDHTQPIVEALFEVLEVVMPRCPSLRAVTYEADGHSAPVARRNLERLRRLVSPDPRPAISWPPDADGGRAQPSRGSSEEETPIVLAADAAEEAWAVFDERWGRSGARDDPEGVEAELDFRLAVTAETLDRRMPLCRLLFAEDRDGLLAFVRSDAFRAVFESGGDVTSAFARHCRGLLRDAPDEGATRLLALELHALEVLSRPARGPLDPGAAKPGVGASSTGADRGGDVRRGGSSEVRRTRFAVDLTEALEAAAMLRRHLRARAGFGEPLADSAGPVLRELAARAPLGMCELVIEELGGRVRIHPSQPG